MKRNRKTVFALLLALVMTLGLAATAGATEVGGTVVLPPEFIPQTPNEPMDPSDPVYKIPFTKTVKLGGNIGPGTTDFTIAVCDVGAHDLSDYPDVKYTATVTTTGAGSYDGELVISGPAQQVHEFVSEGFYVREVNGGASGWTYSEDMYYARFSIDASDGNNVRTLTLCPAHKTDNGYGWDQGNSVDRMSFTNIYTENLTTVEIPFTKTVKLGGNTAPGTTDFTIAVCHVNAHGLSHYPDVKYTATVTTTGAGNYEGKLIISGPESKVNAFFSEGFYVREVKGDLSGWTYSDAVWYVSREGKIFPAMTETTANGESYVVADTAAERMTFENTYTYNTSYTTPDVKPTSSPKTFDAGVALYGVSALLSLTGTALVIKRKNG